MERLKETIIKNKVSNVLIVDDGYDKTPTALDMSIDNKEWDIFFSDLTENDNEIIRKNYPNYENESVEQLKISDEFISLLWNHKDNLSKENIDMLFRRYIIDMQKDESHLSKIEEALKKVDLLYETCGVNPPKVIKDWDIIIIDLFLGSAQDHKAQDNSMQFLDKIVKQRIEKPPLVILMSRSSRLVEKRSEFRDKTGIIESMFRIIEKENISNEKKIYRLLNTLVSHRDDSLKIYNFISAWKVGLEKSINTTTKIMSSIDISGYSKIKRLLLDAEGEDTGSYMVDVFDLILQHELEENDNIIDKAISLNSLDFDSAYLPYITDNNNLHKLVNSVIFKNKNRIKLNSEGGTKLSFGDIIRPVARKESISSYFLKKYNSHDVFLVITPACDLQRCESKNIILLKGNLIPLTLESWTNDTKDRTPIIKIDDEYLSIKWDMKHIETISQETVITLLGKDKTLEIIARLRENSALALQQACLSGIGRVGLLAAMPASYIVEADFYFINNESKLEKILLGNIAPELRNGICYVGRNNDVRNVKTVIFSEDLSENLHSTLDKLNIEEIIEKNRNLFGKIRESFSLQEKIWKGISLNKKIGIPQNIKAIIDGVQKNVGMIIENPDDLFLQKVMKGKESNDIALIISVKKIDSQ